MDDIPKRLTELLRCYSDLSEAKKTSDVPALVDFAFSHCISPFQAREELVEFMRIVADLTPTAGMEIGTCGGGTLFLLARLANPKATIISLDLPRGKFGAGYHPIRIPLYKRFAGPRQKMTLLREDSHSQETFDRVKGILGGSSLDYLFIDGDHTLEGVKRDFGMYSSLVRKGGLVGFHDIARVHGRPPRAGGESGGDVPQFWDEVKLGYQHREIIAPSQYGGYGIGVLWI